MSNFIAQGITDNNKLALDAALGKALFDDCIIEAILRRGGQVASYQATALYLASHPMSVPVGIDTSSHTDLRFYWPVLPALPPTALADAIVLH